MLKEPIGKGGMGTVFRASHAVSLAPVAVKLLHPRWSSRAEFRRSLLAEARKAGRVVHEHCARVLDVGEAEDGTVYLAMELADCEPVDALVRRAQCRHLRTHHVLVPAAAPSNSRGHTRLAGM